MALFSCSALITTEILRSDDPWAMALILIAALPKLAKNLAETPCVPAMPLPTIAKIAHSLSLLILEIRFKLSS